MKLWRLRERKRGGDEAMAIVVEAMGLVAMFRNYCTEAVGGCDEVVAAA